MSAVVLVALDGDDAGVVVLGPVRDGARAVLSSCALGRAELAAYLRRMADVYGRTGARWGCGSAEDALAVAELAADSERAIVSVAGRLDALPRPVKSAGVAGGAWPLAYRRARALARAFPLRRGEA